MNRTGLRSAVVVALVLASAAFAQHPTSGPAPLVKIMDQRLRDQIWLRLASVDDCVLEKLGPKDSCPIPVTTIADSQGHPHCLALVPNVIVKTDPHPFWHPDHRRMIRWRFDRDTLSDGAKDLPLSFDHELGIVIIKDDDKQVDTLGKIGDGFGSTDKHFFRIWTLRDKVKAQTNYLPVIFWGEGDDAQICAAADPKIVNI